MIKHIVILVVVGLLSLILGLGIFLLSQLSTTLVVHDQPLRTYLVVQKLVFSSNGFIVIKNANEFNKPGSKIYSLIVPLTPGIYNKFSIQLNPNIFTQQNSDLTRGTHLYVVLYEDKNHDGQLSADDPVAKDSRGNLMVAEFTVL